jgi:ribosomal protein L37AE/L43A
MQDPVKRPDRGYATARRDAPVRCPICESTVARRSRQQVYCSRKCMRKGNNARKAADAFKKPARYPHSRDVPDAYKLENKNNVLQNPKTGSSLFCNGPINILGGGCSSWPGAVRLDSKTLANIIGSEIGGEVVVAPDEEMP